MKFQPDMPGSQQNPYSNDPNKNPIFVQKGVAASVLDIKKNKEELKGKNKDVFVSDDILMCTDPSEKRKRRRNVDEHIEQVTKSCLDLEIDG